MFVLIIDYGSGNIKSVYNSVKRTLHSFNKFSEVKVSRNLSEIEKADKIILPGVGSFDQCMNRIKKINHFFYKITFCLSSANYLY